MYWNETIDLLKKHYPAQAFSVPAAHLARKRILRQIETQFIRRPSHYYDLNNFTPRFSHWWHNVKATSDFTIESNLYVFLESVIDPDQSFWVVCEFSGETRIYKAKLKPILSLIALSYSWTRTFHIVQLKYDYMLSLRYDEVRTEN
jgi:hypothetical protein